MRTGGIENILFCWPFSLIRWCKRHRTTPASLLVKAGTELGKGSDSSVPKYLKEIIIDKARSVQQNKQRLDSSIFATSPGGMTNIDETSSVATRKSLSTSVLKIRLD